MNEINDDVIWRYLTLSKFIDLLQCQSLYLCRADRFDDHTEGEWFAHISTKSHEEMEEYFSIGLGAIKKIRKVVDGVQKKLSIQQLKDLINQTISPEEYSILDDTDDLDQLLDESFFGNHDERLEWLGYIQEKHEDLVKDTHLSEEERKAIGNDIRSLKHRSFISSWFGGYSQCMAMWKTYCSGYEGVAITTTKTKLRNLYKNNKKFLLSQKANSALFDVVYIDSRSTEVGPIIPRHLPDGVWMEFRDLILKHSAYEYEREHRFVVTFPIGVGGLPLGIKLEIVGGLNAFIDHVFLPPTISINHWLFNVVQTIMTKFHFDAKKLTVGQIQTVYSNEN